MAKENALLFVIIVLSWLTPSLGFTSTKIETTQRIIVIDPGHGGAQSGLISRGLKEKAIVLLLAKKIIHTLEPRYNAILTRTRDIAVSSRERIFLANRNKADLYLSIHLHSSDQPRAYFYYFTPPGIKLSSTQTADNEWKSQPLFHQAESKQVINFLSNIFLAHNKASLCFSTGAPILLLEGATMPAILIEPMSILLLPQSMDEIDTLLDQYTQLISQSIDLYFRKK